MHPTHQHETVRAAVLTVSDTRTMDTDKGGQKVQYFLSEAQFEIAAYTILKDNVDMLRHQLTEWCADDAINTIILTGGTGFTKRDVTYDAVQSVLEKEMTGFGELFRMLSYDDIGARAMFSRAIAGSVGETAIYALPGSTNAVALGMEKLIIPTVQHFLGELKRT